MIKNHTPMLFFRFSNYREFSFIEEHKSIINSTGYVWLMKIGKRTSIISINKVLKAGGYIVLKFQMKEYICRLITRK